jgi:hypothetical protein
MSEILPAGAFFATQYYDSHRRTLASDIYYEDGRVEAFDGTERTLITQLSGAQIKRLKQQIRSSGLLEADDLEAGGAYDTADYTYAWRLGGQAGQVTNHAYPARTTPAFTAIETLLAEIEAGNPPDESDQGERSSP